MRNLAAVARAARAANEPGAKPDGVTMVPNAVIRDPDLDHVAVVTYAVLLSHGERRPSDAELARQVNASVGAVRRALRVLAERGLVER